MKKIASIALIATLFGVAQTSRTMNDESEISSSQGPFALWLEEQIQQGNIVKPKPSFKDRMKARWNKHTGKLRNIFKKNEKPAQEQNTAIDTEAAAYSLRMAEEPEISSSQGPFALWLEEQMQQGNIQKPKPSFIHKIKDLWRKYTSKLKDFAKPIKTTVAPTPIAVDDPEVAAYSRTMSEEPEISSSEGPFAIWLNEQIQQGNIQKPKPRLTTHIKNLWNKHTKSLRLRRNKNKNAETTQEEKPATDSEISEYSLRMAEEPAIDYSQGPFALWLAEQEAEGYGPNVPLHKKAKSFIQGKFNEWFKFARKNPEQPQA